MAKAEDFTPDRAKPLAMVQGFLGISTLKVLLMREIYRLEAEPQEIVGPNPESLASLQDGGEQGAEALLIEKYDSLNVKQVTSRLGKSSIEEIERLQDYEAERAHGNITSTAVLEALKPASATVTVFQLQPQRKPAAKLYSQQLGPSLGPAVFDVAGLRLEPGTPRFLVMVLRIITVPVTPPILERRDAADPFSGTTSNGVTRGP
jgi:hypothetical protein